MPFSAELLRQLIATFQSEMDEGVNVIINGLLELDKAATDPAQRAEIIESIFRTAHNLKGAARGLGIMSVGEIAHGIESIFLLIQKSDQSVAKERIDLCLEAVDKMRSAMQAYIDDVPLNFDLDDLRRRLFAGSGISIKPTNMPAPVNQVKEEQPELPSHTTDTVRVPLSVIDKLSELSDEIQASKIELDDHVSYTKSLLKVMHEFSSSWNAIHHDMLLSFKSDPGSRLMRNLNKANDELAHLLAALHKISNDISAQATDYTRLSRAVQDEVVQLRLVPANNLLSMLPRQVRELANELNKKVELEISGDDIYIDKYVLEGMKDPITHLLRNAIDHGIETPAIRLQKGKDETGLIKIDVKDNGHQIIFEISDDGGGVNLSSIKNKISKQPKMSEDVDRMSEAEILNYIFKSGFSTKNEVSSVSGRGVGLDVVKKNIQALKGSVAIENRQDKGVIFTLVVPLSISSERGLIIKVEDNLYVLPTSAIDRVIHLARKNMVALEGEQVILLDGHPVVIKSLAQVLGSAQIALTDDMLTLVLIKSGNQTIALAVDQILGEREILLKPIAEPLTHIPCVSGATLLDRNKIAIVLAPDEVFNASLHTTSHNIFNEPATKINRENKRVLVVDDSITTRMMEKNILESKDYQVITAVNGQEAWEIMQKQAFSLVITDLNMPVMDGFELTNKIKSSDKFSRVPVIIVTSLGSDADKARGIEVGADAYIIKNEFESGALLQMIEQLI